MKNLAYEFCTQGINWLFRVRTLGAQMFKGGLALLIVVLGADYAVGLVFQYRDVKLDFQGSAGSGLPAFLVYTAAAIAILMMIVGTIFILRDERIERRKFLVVVEVRGLHSSPGGPAKDAIKPGFRGQRHSVLVDFRPSHAADLVNPELMLSKIQGMKLNVDSAAQGRDMRDVSVAIGGIAAVPGMFLIGMRMEDESPIELYDWNRDLKLWKMIGGFDDGNRPRPLEVPSISAGDTEVVLAVSASYPVADEAIAATFPGLPVVRLAAGKIEANSYWAEEVQRAFATAFRNAVQTILALQVKRIHLVLAAPAGLTLRLGATYDERLHPELVVYQFEKSSTPPYPWGVLLPNHGSAEPSIVRVPAAVPIAPAAPAVA